MRRILLVGSMVVAATAVGCSSTTDVQTVSPTGIAVKRYTASGQLDTATFSGGAVFAKLDPTAFEYALAAAVQGDQKTLATGHSTLSGQDVIALVRFNADGTLDTAGFGAGAGFVRTAIGAVAATGTSVLVQPDGKIVVAASTFNDSTKQAGIALVRYEADGTLDTGFGTGGVVSAELGPGTEFDVVSAVLQGTGIVVGGATTDGNFVLRRYDSSGVPDAAFGSGGTTTTLVGARAFGLALALQTDGKIVAAGGGASSSSALMNTVVARYAVNGTLDPGFGGGTGTVTINIGSGEDFANAVAVQPADGKIVTAGHANLDTGLGRSDIALLRFNPDGSVDTGFGSGGGKLIDSGDFDNAFSLALPDDGAGGVNILVSGNRSINGLTSVALRRFLPSGDPDTTFGDAGAVITGPTGPSEVASGNAVVVQPDGKIVVAGYD